MLYNSSLVIVNYNLIIKKGGVQVRKSKNEYYLEFQQVIDYKFKDKKILKEGLTHSSYTNESKNANEAHNERLEFLGDSVLGLVISHYLFEQRPNMPEGELTKIRANIVCEESLSEVSKRLNVGKYLFLGKGEETTGGRDRTSILADAMEAVIGAVYLDGGIECAKEIILGYMAEIIEDSIEGKIFRDYKTHLQEILQSMNKEKICYKIVDEIGPDHNKKFVMEVRIGSKFLGLGEGRTKKEAEQKAAKEALKKIEEE